MPSGIVALLVEGVVIGLRSGCQELMLLINHVLDAAQASSEVRLPQLEACSVAQTVRDVLEHLGPREQQEHCIHVEVHDHLMVWADPQFVHQILRMLLSNACKYSPGQTAVIINAALSERTAQETDAPSQVCLSVQDAGPGIPPADCFSSLSSRENKPSRFVL